MHAADKTAYVQSGETVNSKRKIEIFVLFFLFIILPISRPKQEHSHFPFIKLTKNRVNISVISHSKL